MTLISSEAASPTKTARFARGNNRVIARPTTLSPARLRLSSPKFLDAQKHARKVSKPNVIKAPSTDDDDESAWQDVRIESRSSQLAPSKVPDLSPVRPQISAPARLPAPELDFEDNRRGEDTRRPDSRRDDFRCDSNRRDSNRRDDGRRDAARDAARGDTRHERASPRQRTPPSLDSRDESASTSFFNFSPTSKTVRFLRQLGRRARLYDDPADEPAVYGRPYWGHNVRAEKPPFWRDPTIPGILALYLQVLFNLVMVLLIFYAIGIFYTTIRNDVNLKVDEYSVDIVAQIAECSKKYVVNGCEPGKRVPALEAKCLEWDRCMQRDPKEVGRAKVSAETFGTIIEAFIQPIGFKSMLFLFIMFAGSFLLVNSVFSSRIGPRHNAAHFQSPQTYPEHGASSMPAHAYPPQFVPSVIYSPSHQSPRRDLPLQSSPVRSPYRY